MVMQKGVGAQLQLSVEDALKAITTLKSKLDDLKKDVSSPLNIKVQLDTSELDKAAESVRKTLNNAITRTTPGSSTSTKANVAGMKAIRQEVEKISNLLQPIFGDVAKLNNESSKLKDNITTSFGNRQMVMQFGSEIKNVSQQINEQRDNVRDLKQEWLNAFASTSRLVGQLAQQSGDILESYRNLGKGLLTGFQSFASNILDTIGFGVSGMIDDAITQERKLQQSRIGFSNMFPGQDVSSMIEQVRTTAAQSPGLNSGDLADYINQLAVVSGGDFSTAFNATMGILKTVQFGGGDANAQMGYIIKNVRDVMAKGKATQVDVQQFNRAMPYLQKSLEAIGASEFLKNGQLKITKQNATNLMSAFASLNTEANPAYGVFEQTGQTLGGLQEEFRETFSTKLAKMLEDVGLFDSLTTLMRGTVFNEIDLGLTNLAKLIREIKDAIDWGEVGEAAANTMQEIKKAIGEFAMMLKDNFGNTDFVKLAINTIGAFFEGLIKGATELGKFLAHVKNTLGEEGFTNLAKSLGQSVTQGIILQKALQGIGAAFSGLGNILQTFAFGRFLTQGLRQGGATSGKGATTGGSISSKIISSSAASAVGSILSSVLKGSAIAGLGTAVANVTEEINLFGDATTTVANVMQSLAYTIGGAVMGSFLGLPGAIATGVGGFVLSLDAMSQRMNREEADKTEETVTQIKKEGGKEFVQGIIDWYKDFGFKGATFDEETEAAQYVKNRLAEYVNQNNEWSTADAQRLFVQAYRQILLHEAGTNLDNEQGFWNLQGRSVDWIKKNEGLQPELTEEGRRLAEVIRNFNLVGYGSSEQLESTPAETLVKEYLKTENLNLSQLEYLENRMKTLDEQIMPLTTDLFTEQEKKIVQAGGDIVKAIETEDDENWTKILNDTYSINKTVQSIDQKILSETAGDKIVNESTAKIVYGEELGGAVYKWQEQQQGMGGALDRLIGNSDLQIIQSLMGTSNINQIIGSIFEERNRLEGAKVDRKLSEEERQAATKQLDIVNDYISKITTLMTENEGDWAGLSTALQNLTLSLALEGNTEIVPQFKNDLDELIKQLRRNLGLDENNQPKEKNFWERILDVLRAGGQPTVRPFLPYAKGGYIKPVFRATGGLGVDTVPAFLQPGEFVQKSSAVSTAGLGVMNALNNGDLASAYRMIGSKISGNWNNSRNTTNQADNRRSIINQAFIFNRNRSGAKGSYNGFSNLASLGY